MNTETWKVVRGFEGLYEVSDLGRVRSLGRVCSSKNNSTQQKRPRILVQEITIHGYCRVRLFDKCGSAKHYAVHRLVLDAFRGESSLQVNHKNEIKTDNRLENLEYVTAAQNCNYGSRNEKIANGAKFSLPVIQQDGDGNHIATFQSIAEAGQKTGVCESNISRCAKGERSTAGGYKWRFV